MKHYYTLVFLFLSILHGHSQDVWLQNHFSPNSGCQLSNTETVTVLVNNNSGVIMTSNTIQLYYTINGGSLTNQPLSSNLTAGASWNFSFSVKANLSACGDHIVKVWVSRPGDVNHLNDTLVWTVRNDCNVSAGTVSGSTTTLCNASNSGNLTLSGGTGTNILWQYSTNSGTNWTNTAINGTTYSYNNLAVTTAFRVYTEGGYCPDANTSMVTIPVDLPVPGTIAGSDTVNTTVTSGTLTLQGAKYPVAFWEYSHDEGDNWSVISNTSTTLSYANVTVPTWYRANTQGGDCPAVYSDTAVIHFEHILSAVGIKKNSLTVYPNPADQWISLSPEAFNFNKEAYLRILTSTGEQVFYAAVSNAQTSQNIEMLAPGIYIVQFITDENVYTGKLVKK